MVLHMFKDNLQQMQPMAPKITHNWNKNKEIEDEDASGSSYTNQPPAKPR